jgi:AraC-like DNA-binding protein
LNAVADHIHLSPERTRHLFLEQIDVPFSQYVLWRRTKAVLIAVTQGKQNFHGASLQYGFTDQSHFNRFFKRMFGISASMVLKNSRLVQFIYLEV